MKSPEQAPTKTLVEVLRSRAEQEPGRIAFDFRDRGTSEPEVLAYSELDRRARSVAAWLQASGTKPGDRVLLLYPPGLDYISAFLGCLYAGVVAVPSYPPSRSRSNNNIALIDRIAKAAGVSKVFCTKGILEILPQIKDQAPTLASVAWVPLNEVLSEDLSGKWREPNSDFDSLAFLQYTSGSTGNPKGVMVSHGNIVHNSIAIARAFEVTLQSVGFIWLPPYHDMGLIGGVIQPLYSGFPCTLLSPLGFAMKPFRWLEGISKSRATVSGGPNFAYELCVETVTDEQIQSLDLSCWSTAFTGAEPIRKETLDRFAARFAACGFNPKAYFPCYGLAEGTLCVTGVKQGSGAKTLWVDGDKIAENEVELKASSEKGARAIVGCGHGVSNQITQIVDPESKQALPDGRIGEIWVHGPSVAHGYYADPELTQEAFHARILGADGKPSAEKFMRTGDLGFLRDGEFYITGRLKDLIIVRGRNYYPTDVEMVAQGAAPSLLALNGAAFSIEVDGEEKVVLVNEVDSKDKAFDPIATSQLAIEALAEKSDLQLYELVQIRARTIPKTTSGKIQRRATKAAYLDGTLEVIHRSRETSKVEIPKVSEAPPKSVPPVVVSAPKPVATPVATKKVVEIERWLIERIAKVLHRDAADIGTDVAFATLGLVSLDAIRIAADLGDWIGTELAPTLFYDYPNVSSLARELAGEARRAGGAEESVAVSGEREPVAIIGMSCRFPGASSAEAFWENLAKGVDSITEVPSDRWDIKAYYSDRPGAAGKMSTRFGGFVDGADQFGAEFFSILPIEASKIDPQQRLLMEVTAEALENARIPFDRLSGTKTGVFVGLSGSDYALMQARSGQAPDLYAATGNSHSIAANRISYWLNLHGPSVAVDSACSSSLLAIHLAYQNLLTGASSLAIAGGVNLILDPACTIAFSQAMLMSPQGRCQAFSDSADGFVRSEGAGVVILKRLSDAQRDGDPILGLIRGGCTNQDGKTNGITAPNGDAQEAVIRGALSDARLDPSDIDYLEAHGTGTKLGDPIEYRALATVFDDRKGAKPLILGSTKTNIGHLEAAAGVAGVIRVLLSLQKEKVPKHLHFTRLNSVVSRPSRAIDIASSGTRAWSKSQRTRRAGVSSFGFGGTNVHLILEEPPAPKERKAVPGTAGKSELFMISASDENSLKALANRYQERLESESPSLAELALSSRQDRSAFAKGFSVVTHSIEDLKKQLSTFSSGGRAERSIHASRLPPSSRKLAFLFTGQGAQGAGMARDLYEHEPVFRKVIQDCADAFGLVEGRGLIDLLYHDAELGTENPSTAIVQPALFAIEAALFRLWQSWNVHPEAVLGHSLGEITAAWAAGAMTLEEGLRLVQNRGRLMQSTSSEGTMGVVFLNEEVLRDRLEKTPEKDRIELAALNGPGICTVTGKKTAMESLFSELEKEKVNYRRLAVSRAFHSQLMEPILDEFERVAASITFKPLAVPLASNVTGEVMPAGTLLDAKYWRRQIRMPTLFQAGIESLLKSGVAVFLELGPKSVLRDMGKRCPGAEKARWISSLGATDDAQASALLALSELSFLGFKPDWRAVDAQRSTELKRLDLPFTPYLKKSYWNFPRGGTNTMASTQESNQASAAKSAGGVDQILPGLRATFSPLIGVPADEIDVDQPLTEMGADSLLLLRAIQILEDSFGIKLTVTQLFRDIPTMRALAEYIEANQKASAPAPAPASAPKPVAVTAQPVATSSREVPVTLPPIAALTPPAMSGNKSQLERIIDDQLKILQQQLKLLSTVGGTSGAPASMAAPASASLVSEPVLTPTPAPAHASGGLAKTDRFAAFLPKSKVKEKLDDSKQRHLDQLIKDYTSKSPKSKSLAQEFRKHLSDCRAVAGFRPSVKEMVYPIVGVKAQGSHIWDIDGNEYIDFTMGFGTNLLGHNPPFVNQAIDRQLKMGFQIGPQSELAGRVAKVFCELTGLERICFCNSGTEAVMTAARIARATTKRDPIVIFSGSYHGTFDGFLGRPGSPHGGLFGAPSTAPVAPGITKNLVGDLIILDYGTPEALEFFRREAGKIAAVIVEPVQSRHPELQPKEFLREVREITANAGCAMIFDETITGFRVAPGGAQEYFGVRADVATYGKILGGGLPIGAIAGSAKFMDCIDGGKWSFGDDSFPEVDLTFFAGTFSKHPLTMAASLATLEHLKSEGAELQNRLARKTEKLAAELNAFFKEEEFPIELVYFRSLFRFEFSGNLDLLFYHLTQRGIFIWEGRNCFISTEHTDHDIQNLVQAVKDTLRDLRASGMVAQPGKKSLTPQGRGSGPGGDPGQGSGRGTVDPFSNRFARLCREGGASARAAEIAVGVDLRGRLDSELLKKAWDRLQTRHEALRASVDVSVNEFSLIRDGVSGFSKSDWKGGASFNANAWIRERASMPIDPKKAPAVKAELLRVSEDRHCLLFQAHHLLCDGYAAVVVLSEWMETYAGLLSGKPPEYPEPARWFEVLARESELLATQRASQSSTWSQKLSGARTLSLPRPQAAAAKPKGTVFECSVHLGREQLDHLKKAAKGAKTTLFQYSLACFIDALEADRATSDSVVGIASANREFPGSEFLIANRVNLLPVRPRLDSGTSAQAKVDRVKQTLMDAFSRGSYPYEWLRADSLARADREPFQIVFNFEPFNALPKVPGLELSVLDCPVYGAEFDGYVNVIVEAEGLKMTWVGDASRVDALWAEKWLNSYAKKLGDWS